jgi:hypothetical protein
MKHFGIIRDHDTIHYYTYSPDAGIHATNDQSPKAPCLIADTLLDVKTVDVPVVSKSLLPDIVYNTIKKHSAAKPSPEQIDFTVLRKEQNRYTVLVFIYVKPMPPVASARKLYSMYSLVHALQATGKFDRSVRFLVEEEEIFYHYVFDDGIFIKRDIYFKKNLKSLDTEMTYTLGFGPHKKSVDQFKIVTDECIMQAVAHLKNPVFKQKKEMNPLHLFAAGFMLILIIISIALQINFSSLKQQRSALEQSRTQLSDKLTAIQNERGMTDETYKAYMTILEKRSTIDLFFSALHDLGIGNIQIDSVTYTDNQFSITGSCKNDSTLEEAFRSSGYWSTVSFSFSRKKNRIMFRISGVFNAF